MSSSGPQLLGIPLASIQSHPKGALLTPVPRTSRSSRRAVLGPRCLFQTLNTASRPGTPRLAGKAACTQKEVKIDTFPKCLLSVLCCANRKNSWASFRTVA